MIVLRGISFHSSSWLRWWN